MLNLNSKKDIKTLLNNLLYDEILSIKGVNKIKDIKGKVDLDTKEIICDIFLYLDLFSKIPDVSWEVQNITKQVLKTIENIKIKAINIYIVGIK